MTIYVDPTTQEPLVRVGDELVGQRSRRQVARFEGPVAVFVPDEGYAGSFGFQWNAWEHAQSNARGARLPHRRTILERSRIEEWDTSGKTVLECGMGGGDDTEVLLTFPFAQVHAFDLSRSVDRAAKYLSDPRLHLARASIMEMPYPDGAFDVVWCHRVLQHTPDPLGALRRVCRKVKPGGILFAHCYKRSWRYLLEFKYKYRWLTRRLPHRWVFEALERVGPALHVLNDRLYGRRLTRLLALNFVPFYHYDRRSAESCGMSDAERLEWEKLATFDALTPRFDAPVTTRRFTSVLAEEGFEVRQLFDPPTSPIICTAVRRR